MGELQAKQSALQSPETLATVAHAIIRKQYGEDAYEWSPTTIYLELEADFSTDPDGTVLDRWSAMSIVMTSDAFFKRLDAFMGICNTFSSGQPFFQVFDPVSVEEAAWGITEVSLNRELLPFSYSVKKYLQQILRADGYEEGSYPAIFREAMEVRPSAKDIRQALQKDPHNTDNLEAYIDDQLRDMTYQFNKIPDLRDLDDIILQRSMDEFVGNLTTKAV